MKSRLKKILIIEDSKEINEAINLVDREKIEIHKNPILDENWFQDFLKTGIQNHPLINKYNIEINPDNTLLKSFYALYINKYDGLILGHVYTSKTVFIYAIIFYGSNHTLSSCFICDSNDNLRVWSDCALNINPNIELMKKIIINSIDFYINNISDKSEINVHLLSFSTYENSNDESIHIYNELINDQTWIKQIHPKINLIGPIQYDAAVNKEIYTKKTNFKHYYSPDIFIFPNLNAGNISYKIEAQYSKFYGPFVCGIDKKIADLSRSATTDEIYKTIQFISGIKK